MKRLMLLIWFVTVSTFSWAQDNETVRAINGFASDLFEDLGESEGNEFFSPYSVTVALAMVAEGARGETAEEFRDFFKLSSGKQIADSYLDDFHRSLAQLDKDMQPFTMVNQNLLEANIRDTKFKLDELRKSVCFECGSATEEQSTQENELVKAFNSLNDQLEPYKLSVANAIWLDKTMTLKKAYSSKMSEIYKVESVFKVDFAKNNKQVLDNINQWCADNTNNKIKTILDSVDRSTKMILANAIYFKGVWEEPFEESSTENRKFSLASGAAFEVPMMSKYETIKYAAFNADGTFFDSPEFQDEVEQKGDYPQNGYQMVELPYKGKKLSMLVLVPMEIDGTKQIIENFNYYWFRDAISKLNARTVGFRLPKFSFATNYKLSDTLKTLGLESAFNNADFSGISPSSLAISEVIHKAYVDVNEKGTEAAAVTAIVMMGSGMPRFREKFNPLVYADRPFLFAIVHKETNAILFMGKVNDPR